MSLGQNNFPNYGAMTSDLNPRPRSSSDLSLFNQLCDNISCNIFSINNNVAALENSCKDIGTKVDSETLRDKIHGYRQSTNELVGTTTHFVKDLQRIVQRGVSKEQRFQARRLENEFRETVKRYDVLQTQLVPKMKQALLFAEKEKKNQAAEPDVWGVSGYEEEKADEEQRQAQQQLHAELELEHGLLLERDARIRQIEADILDVNVTFKELGAIVHEQGDIIGTIEENITTTAYNVETGAEQLSKASGYQKKYRKKLCWLVLLLLVISIVIAIIIYVST